MQTYVQRISLNFLLLVTFGVLENMRWILPTPAISEKMTLFDMTRMTIFCASFWVIMLLIF